MKRCPQCNRVESEETLTFCRVDGTPLVRESGSPGEGAGTLRFGPAPATGDTETRILPTGETPGRPTAPTTVLDGRRASGHTQELSKRKSRGGVVIAAAAAAALALGAAAYLYLPRDRAGAAKNSVAVLPFQNASGDPGVDYLSDGISESLINSLSQLPGVKVIARSTMFSFKGKELDPQEVGRRLGVETVLTGRVVQLGDSLSVQADLVNVADGTQMWGERYNRKASDIIAVQEDIAREIAGKLSLRLSGEQQGRVNRRYTENAEAYRFYLKGRYQLGRRTEDSFKLGVQLFQQAIAQDPDYALAHAGLADAYNQMGLWTTLPPGDAFPKAKAAAEKALQIDDTLAEAHTALAFEMFTYEWDFAGAERECQRAISLNPNYATARELYGYQMYIADPRRFQDAMRELKTAQEIDPLSSPVNFNIAALLYFERQYDAAIEQLKTVQSSDPNFTLGYGLLGAIYAQKGMYDETVAAYSKASTLEGSSAESVESLNEAYQESGIRGYWKRRIEILQAESKQRYVSPYFIAIDYAFLGENERAFEWLGKAYQERSSWLAELGVEPVWTNMRSDPRFAELMRKVGLPQ